MKSRLDNTHDIQVSGKHNFSDDEWVNAIGFFISGIQHKQEMVMCSPKIALGNVTLRFMGDHFGAYITSDIEHDFPISVEPGQESMSDNSAESVLNALTKFVEEDDIIQITIHIKPKGSVTLWKRFGRYHYCATDLMSSSEYCRMYGVKE